MEHSLNTYITIIPPCLFSSSYVQAKLAEFFFFFFFFFQYICWVVVVLFSFLKYFCLFVCLLLMLLFDVGKNILSGYRHVSHNIIQHSAVIQILIYNVSP